MQPTKPVLVALLILGLAGCASTAPAPEPAAPPPDLDLTGPPPDPEFAGVLDRAAGGDWDYLRIDAGCRAEPSGWDSTVLFGSGAGIFDEARTFRVERDRLIELLARFQEIGFASMPATIGGSRKAEPEGEPAAETQGAAAPLQAVCVLGLRVDGRVHRVQQLDRGERSAALVGLTEEILEVGAEGEGGSTADSLADGLDLLARGELAPEALRLTVNHRDADGDGWLLTVDGAFAWAQPITAGDGYGEQRTRPLGAALVGRIARALQQADFGGLPGNLYDDGYVHVRVDLLGHEHEVLAQPFAGMSESTHPAAQQRFADAAVGARRLARWVLDAPAGD